MSRLTTKHSIAQNQLYDEFLQCATNSNAAPIDVIVAALSIVVEAHRRCNRSWTNAETEFDRTVARAKQVLRDQYLIDGRRKPPSLLDKSGLILKH